MKILHYFLGFPPYRSGGLTKYAFDLMTAQSENGDEVAALWPGQMNIINKKLRVMKRHAVQGILNYEIINPLPVPLDEGIMDVGEFIKPYIGTAYIKFLEESKPNIIHVHTLMGIHKEFFEAAKKLGIKLVFTTHDYFGICSKVTLYHDGNVCVNDHGCNDCIQCNFGALSLNKIGFMQSPVYRTLKNSIVIKYLRSRHRKNFFEGKSQNTFSGTPRMKVKASDYERLREYYKKIFSYIDMFHFNSSVAEKIYKKYVSVERSCVLSLTHKDVADNRTANLWKYSGKLKITLLAPAKPFKGFHILIDALDEMWKYGNRDFVLNLYGTVTEKKPYLNIQKEGFTYEQLREIFANTDILVAPSIWYETFGFTVLEALSYCVPVIVSDRVGAKDIVGNGGIIVPAGDVEKLKEAIESLNENTLKKLRKAIQEEITIKTWTQFVSENYELYARV